MGVLGDKAKKFTNVYVKNFPEGMTQDRLQTMFEAFGPISSVKVIGLAACYCGVLVQWIDAAPASFLVVASSNPA